MGQQTLAFVLLFYFSVFPVEREGRPRRTQDTSKRRLVRRCQVSVQRLEAAEDFWWVDSFDSRLNRTFGEYHIPIHIYTIPYIPFETCVSRH